MESGLIILHFWWSDKRANVLLEWICRNSCMQGKIVIVCAGNGEEFVFAKSVGVGLIESSIGLMRLCLRESVDSLLFVGSAGAYDKHIPLFDVYLADSATHLELGFLQSQSYTPIDNRIDSGVLENVPCETIGLQKTIVNSSNYITIDEGLAQRLGKAGIWLENMEFFAVMRVAQYFQIPCVGLFCVSNYCDEHAHKNFLASHAKVKEILTSHHKTLQRIESYILGKKL